MVFTLGQMEGSMWDYGLMGSRMGRQSTTIVMEPYRLDFGRMEREFYRGKSMICEMDELKL